MKKENSQQPENEGALKENRGSVNPPCTYRGVSRAQEKKITNLIFEKLRKAIEEVDTQLVTTTTKTKVIEYNLEAKPDKPTKEILTECEKSEYVKGVVDRQGLKQITAILKELKEISLFNAELDFEEQAARVENLIAQAQSRQGEEESGVNCGVVVIPEKQLMNDN